jgi:peptidoglycan/LPS O-acetylase OafA/YrhL
LVTLLLLVGWALLAPRLHLQIDSGNYPFLALPSQLLMTHVWPLLYGGRWNFPSWSISAEWFAYLAIFPLARLLLKRGRWSAGGWLGIGWLVLAANLFIGRHEWPVELMKDRRLAVMDVSLAFLSGAAFFAVFRRGGAVVRGFQAAATPLAALLVVLLTAVPGVWPAYLALLLMPALLLALTADRTSVGRMLSTKPALWLGRISYSIYMSHAFVLQVWRAGKIDVRLGEAPLPVRLLLIAGSIVAVIALGAAFYYLVETPGRHLFRKLATRGKTPEPVGAAIRARSAE